MGTHLAVNLLLRYRRQFLSVLLLALMLGASGLAMHFTPHQYLADKSPRSPLSAAIPNSFGNWHVDESGSAVVADPTATALADRIYTETVTRTFVNTDSGQRVMLTIAYGKDQSEAMQVHTPEVCYPAQGFSVSESTRTTINLAEKQQPVIRLRAQYGTRSEFITYWLTMGDYVVNGGNRDRRNLRFKFGFDGVIPDGLLFRVSSIGSDPVSAYELQQQFLGDLYHQLPHRAQEQLFGSMVF